MRRLRIEVICFIRNSILSSPSLQSLKRWILQSFVFPVLIRTQSIVFYLYINTTFTLVLSFNLIEFNCLLFSWVSLSRILSNQLTLNSSVNFISCYLRICHSAKNCRFWRMALKWNYRETLLAFSKPRPETKKTTTSNSSTSTGMDRIWVSIIIMNMN